MRIGIDGYNLVLTHGTGVATYGASLAHVLRNCGHAVEGIFGLYADPRAERREVQFFDRFAHGHRIAERSLVRQVALATAFNHLPRRLSPVPLTQAVDRRSFGYRFPRFDALWTHNLLFEQAYARFKYLRRFTTVTMPDPPDVMHWTYPVPVRMKGARNVYTIHDLVPLRLPQATLDDKRYYYQLVQNCIDTADHIITVSEASRRDILSLFTVAEAKVTNTYQSSPVPPEVSRATREQDAAMIRSIFGLEQDNYYLFFGAIDPKKNIGRIVDAYLSARSDRKLVIVSSRDWGMDAETRMLGPDGEVYGRKLGRKIIRLQYLPRPTLFRLIAGARAVLFPSLYEGFGLPALEAIQMDTPVIGSTASSLPEVIGDAGLMVDPYNTAEIAEAIRRLDSDDALVGRLAAAAPAQAAKFSDDAWARALASVHDGLRL